MNKWIHYTKHIKSKNTSPTLSAEEYIEITDDNSYLAEESNARSYCEEWADNVNNEGLYSERGYTYSFEIVDKPSVEWLSKEINILNNKISYYANNGTKYRDYLESLLK